MKSFKRSIKRNYIRKKRRTYTRKRLVGGSDDSIYELIKFEKTIERTKKDAPTEVHGIPLIIYRIWHKDAIPKRMKQEIVRSIEKTPEFDNKFYTLQDCEELIIRLIKEEKFEQNILNAFRCVRPHAYKADIARYCILYIYGGVYIDSKLEILEPLLPILTEKKMIFANEDKVGNGYGIYNGFMACPPKNKLFRLALDEIIQNCKNRDYKGDQVDITGPRMLGRIVKQLNKENEIQSLYMDFDMNNGIQKVVYANHEIVKEYTGYRDNQAMQTNDIPQYRILYGKREVFDTSIVFE